MHTRQRITFQGSCTNSGILLGPVESHCFRTTGCRHRGLPSSVFLNPSCGFMNIQFTLQNFSCYQQV